MRVGIAHHLGWAVAVTATTDHEVVDRLQREIGKTNRDKGFRRDWDLAAALEDIDWVLDHKPEGVDLERVRELRRLVAPPEK